ncbi:HNH endonuclease [Streptomyces lavendulae]|uniref:HNH endonuclease n=1 Tax=Streptomyces lavendulae TaxID=1914 RepID=UPI00372353EC
MSAREWRGFLATDAATYSRLLHFSRKSAPARCTDPEPGSWRHELAAAYGWAFNTRPELTYTRRARRQWHMIRTAVHHWEDLAERHADFFVRIGDHVSRIAGTLATTERTAIHSAHVESAWSLTRRAVLDTADLAAMDRSAVEQFIKDLDEMLSDIEPEEGQAAPIRPVQPEHSSSRLRGSGRHGQQQATGSSSVRKLKEWYQDQCQMCAAVLVLPSPRHRYSEAAHIRAREDDGPDVVENLLCLCPNCHVLFDAGARILTDDLRVVDTVTGRLGERIRLHRWHFIDLEFVRHHRRRWTGDECGGALSWTETEVRWQAP